MATFTFAKHVQGFEGSGYKRAAPAGTGPALAAKRLSKPTDSFAAPSPFPATSARPDQRVNVRVPVARACWSRLLPGQVAFVHRCYKMGNAGGLGGLTHVASMEELNDMLSVPKNFLNLFSRELFKQKVAKSVYEKKRNDSFKRQKFYAFDTDVIEDSSHPILQFALDGLVATRTEEVDEHNTSSSASAQQACIVAVKGHAPMNTVSMPSNVHTGVLHSVNGSMVASPTSFLQPVSILDKVYVVLVAVMVAEKKWRLQYETVTASNLEMDAAMAPSSYRLFHYNLFIPAVREIVLRGMNTGERVVLRAMELGSVVDTFFGEQNQRQLVVCVHIRPYEVVFAESTGSKRVVRPVHVARTFEKRTKEDLRNAKRAAGAGGANTTLRRTDGIRPKIIRTAATGQGVSADQVAALTNLVTQLQDTVRQLNAKIDKDHKDEIERLNAIETKVVAANKKSSNGDVKTLLETIRADSNTRKKSLAELKSSVDRVGNKQDQSLEAVKKLANDATQRHEAGADRLRELQKGVDEIQNADAAEVAQLKTLLKEVAELQNSASGLQKGSIQELNKLNEIVAKMSDGDTKTMAVFKDLQARVEELAKETNNVSQLSLLIWASAMLDGLLRRQGVTIDTTAGIDNVTDDIRDKLEQLAQAVFKEFDTNLGGYDDDFRDDADPENATPGDLFD